MKTKFLKKLAIVTVSILGLAACNNNSGSSTPTPPSNNNDQSTAPSLPSAWQDIQAALDGTVNGGIFNGFLLIKIDSAAQTINLFLPFLSSSLGSISPITPTDLAHPAGSKIGPVTMPDGSTGVAVTIPLKYLLRGGTQLPPLGTLPNGNPLPNFPAGAVNGTTINLPLKNQTLTLYVATNTVAVFITVPDIKIPFGFMNTLLNAIHGNAGSFAVIPNQGSFAGGVYLVSQVPADVATVLNGLVRF